LQACLQSQHHIDKVSIFSYFLRMSSQAFFLYSTVHKKQMSSQALFYTVHKKQMSSQAFFYT
jgi:hypothetical protein